jgi:hypothetical protein
MTTSVKEILSGKYFNSHFIFKIFGCVELPLTQRSNASNL